MRSDEISGLPSMNYESKKRGKEKAEGKRQEGCFHQWPLQCVALAYAGIKKSFFMLIFLSASLGIWKTGKYSTFFFMGSMEWGGQKLVPTNTHIIWTKIQEGIPVMSDYIIRSLGHEPECPSNQRAT